MKNVRFKKLCIIGILGLFIFTIPFQAHAGLRDNFLLKMNFEDNLEDDSTYDNDNGILDGTNPPVYVDGLYGTRSISFNGGDSSYVTIPDADSLDFGTGDFSISVWLKTSENSGVFMQKTIGYAGYTMNLIYGAPSLWVKDVNDNVCRFRPADTLYSDGSYVLHTINDNTWHHIVVTVDRDDPDGVVFYIDNARVAHTVGEMITTASGSLSNDVPLRLGCHYYQNGYDYEGLMDSLTLIDRVITAGEVAAMYYLPMIE